MSTTLTFRDKARNSLTFVGDPEELGVEKYKGFLYSDNEALALFGSKQEIDEYYTEVSRVMLAANIE